MIILEPTIIDGTPMSEWDTAILAYSAGYWQGKVFSPDPHSTVKEQKFYRKAAREAQQELQRRKVTEILLQP